MPGICAKGYRILLNADDFMQTKDRRAVILKWSLSTVIGFDVHESSKRAKLNEEVSTLKDVAKGAI